MLIPMLVGTCVVASLVFPFMGLKLVEVVRSGKSTVISLFGQDERFRWTCCGWLIVLVGTFAVPFPFVVMATSSHYDYSFWMFAYGAALFVSVVGMISEYSGK